VGVGKCILEHEEWEQKQKLQNLNGSQLAVCLFLYAYQRRAKMKIGNDMHNAVDGFIAIVFSEETAYL
jgi:hypothetical protein